MLKSFAQYKKYDYYGACTFYLGAIVVTLIAQALAGVFAAALAKAIPDIAENGDFATAFMIVIQLFNAAFIVVFCNRHRRKPDCAEFGAVGARVKVGDVVVPLFAATVLLLGMYLPTLWYGYFARYALHIPPDFGNIKITGPATVVMLVIASVVMAPVFEEIIYRGVLFNGLKTQKSAAKAVALSALAFMMMHMSPVQVVFQFALGVLSACVMHRTGKLFPSVLLHATSNALALVVQLTPLAAVAADIEYRLVNNVIAAFFVTLALFVAAGGALFALVRFGLARAIVPAQSGDGKGIDGEQSVDDTMASNRDGTADGGEKIRIKDGTVRYCIALGVSAIVLLITLLTVAVS